MEASSRRYTVDILVTCGDWGGGERGNNTCPMTICYFNLFYCILLLSVVNTTKKCILICILDLLFKAVAIVKLFFINIEEY